MDRQFNNLPERRMFVLLPEEDKRSCYWSDMGDKRTHARWFQDMGWPEDTIETCTRGYYMETEVMLYKGNDFRADDQVINDAIKMLGNLKKQGCPSGIPVYVGTTLLATLGIVPHKLKVTTTK